MTTINLPQEGSCRCGRVRLRISKAPMLTMACHCTGCQKMSASAFSLSAAIPTEGFEVIEGEPVIGGLHGASKHYFCEYCMTWMFTRPEGVDFFVNVRTTMLATPEAFAPYVETFTSEKLPWATTPAEHSYPTYPEMDVYERLMKGYAATIA
ncbi:GFA family protein [Rhizobium sp. TH2]|uniref:GFA family protein n=1 Tax=Rhizobium sp. TH2 TaxID=2775403 RepID=UPI0021589135|nr:GFA family protein [Rhizobium sp. TH2]UVC09494.1 GFA family protein [Rhizobium sp. TH2]